MILGVGALTDADGAAVLGHVMQLVSGTNCKLLVLHTAASRVGTMDVGETILGYFRFNKL